MSARDTSASAMESGTYMNEGVAPLEPAVSDAGRQSGDASVPDHVTVIEPAKGWQLINFRELWRYRELLYFLTWRDVKVRYKQTLLGAAWAILQPFLTMIVFTVVINKIGRVNTPIPYPLFALSTLALWYYFSNGVSLTSARL